MEKAEVNIQVSKRGPYIVKGSVKLIGTNGEEIIKDDMIALCRCGGSNNKPYCDGSHTNISFTG
jgi:CDGSH-type Zn-finger protein